VLILQTRPFFLTIFKFTHGFAPFIFKVLRAAFISSRAKILPYRHVTRHSAIFDREARAKHGTYVNINGVEKHRIKESCLGMVTYEHRSPRPRLL
jgi:hypothetical protein